MLYNKCSNHFSIDNYKFYRIFGHIPTIMTPRWQISILQCMKYVLRELFCSSYRKLRRHSFARNEIRPKGNCNKGCKGYCNNNRSAGALHYTLPAVYMLCMWSLLLHTLYGKRHGETGRHVFGGWSRSIAGPGLAPVDRLEHPRRCSYADDPCFENILHVVHYMQHTIAV